MLWADEGMMTYRFCSTCTQAQADSWTDEGKSLEARYGIRFEREIQEIGTL